jgi:predicted negative regulator of RcsB-dependent stress response
LTDYLTEQEQIELLKNWIKQYSLVILAGVALAAIIITGWRYWQERQARILTHASAIYDEMLAHRAQNDQGGALVQAEKLYSRYSSTVYGQLSALMIARDAINKKNYLEAKKKLQWVIDHSKINAFRQIARVRLARILIAEKKPEAALKILEIVNDKSFSGLTNEVRGDAYYAMKNNTKARAAYEQALSDLPNAEVIRPLLQMKYDNLANFSTTSS